MRIAHFKREVLLSFVRNHHLLTLHTLDHPTVTSECCLLMALIDASRKPLMPTIYMHLYGRFQHATLVFSPTQNHVHEKQAKLHILMPEYSQARHSRGWRATAWRIGQPTMQAFSALSRGKDKAYCWQRDALSPCSSLVQRCGDGLG